MPRYDCLPCTFDYPLGDGNGVAEAISNWGFSNEVVSPGHELSRMVCLLQRMEELKDPPKCCPPPCKPRCPPPVCTSFCQMNRSKLPRKPPLINYQTVKTIYPTSDLPLCKAERAYPTYGRKYAFQRNDKWYKLGPLCCPQPSCPAPYCPTTYKIVSTRGYCT